MDLHDQRFVSIVRFNFTGESEVTPPIFKVDTAWCFHEALRNILLWPADQFDRQTAASNGYEHYVDQAAIVDLYTGRQFASLSRQHDHNSDNDVLIGLRLYPELPGENVTLTTFAGTIAERFQLLFTKKQFDNFLTPSDNYTATLGVIDKTIYDLRMGPLPNLYSSVYNGYDLQQSAIDSGGMHYQKFGQYHLFPSLEEAIVHYLNMPPNHFDTGLARERGYQYSFKTAVVLRGGAGQHLQLRSAFFDFSDGAAKDDPSTGLYCLFKEDLVPVLLKLGLTQLSEGLVANYKHFQVSKLHHGKLVHTENVIAMQEQAMQKNLVPNFYKYSTHTRIYVADLSDLERPFSSPGQHDSYTHTQDFAHAFAYLMAMPLSAYDNENKLGFSRPYHVQEAYIFDENARPVAEIRLNHNDSRYGPAGVYLGLSPTVKDDPFLRACNFALFKDSQESVPFACGGLHYYRIGTIVDQQIQYSHGYGNFEAMVQARLFKDMVAARPELSLRKNSMVSPEDNYAVLLEWDLLTGADQQAKPLTSFIGFRDEPVSAFDAINLIPTELFVQQVPPLEGVQLRISAAHLVQIDDLVPIYSKSQYHAVNDTFAIEGVPDLMPADLRNRFSQLVGPALSSNQRQRFKLSNRNIRPRRPPNASGQRPGK